MHSYRLEQFGSPLLSCISETPAPRGSEVVVRVGSCGVCHSDVHLADGYFDLGNGQKIDLARSVAPPRVLGHEIAGVVAAVGPDATGANVGDARVVYPWIGCGACALCAAGDEQLCAAPRALGVTRDGGFADHVLVPDPKYLLDYAPLTEEQACTYACSGLTAFSALRKAAAGGVMDSLLVVGAGGVGLSGVRMAAHAGFATTIVAEVDRDKWDFARKAGATDVVDPGGEGAARALVKATGGGVSASIDFVGSGSSFTFAFNALRKGGTLVSVGLMGGAASIAPAMLAMKALRVTGSYVGRLDEMRELMETAKSASWPALPVAAIPMSAASEALAALKEGRIRGRAVLKP